MKKDTTRKWHPKKWLPLGLIVCISLTLWLVGIGEYFSWEALQDNRVALTNFVASHLVLALVIYCAIYMTVVGLSLPGATFMTLVGGFLFGQWAGTGAVIFSATLGATLLFSCAKWASSEWMQEKAGPWLTKMKDGFQKDAFSYLLTLRLIPLFPFVAVNLVSALLGVRLKTFFWGTLIGIIPGTFVYVSIGVSLQKTLELSQETPRVVISPEIVISLVGLACLALLPVLYKRFKRS